VREVGCEGELMSAIRQYSEPYKISTTSTIGTLSQARTGRRPGGNRLALGNGARDDDEVTDHVSLQCADVAASSRFYDAVLAPLGGGRVMDFGDVVGFGLAPKPTLWLGPQTTGEGFRETHIAFLAPDRAAVRAFYEAALDSGAESLYEPKPWPEYHVNYYGAFVRDPNGNNVEAVCREPE
jgi:catechol 2,3-dioxygenase-like lactoylglutathione lyase family enzyme